jgi:ABC-2 type transport system permease protein
MTATATADRAVTAPRRRSSAVTGTGRMVRLALRRDRVMMPVWVIATVSVVASTAAAFVSLYPEPAERALFAASVTSNATFRALAGVVYDGTTIGGLTAWRVGTLAVVMLGVMSIFVVTRHTRQEEETGRLELLGSTVLGRRAPLVAGLLVAAGGNALAAVLIIATMVGTGEALAGAVALGLSVGLGGLLFGAVAAVAAQLTITARGANGIASGALGAAYVLRAVGDSAPEGGATWVTSVSPIGWATQVRPYADERWWLLGLMALMVVALLAAAGWLNEHRDFGAGLVAARPGPARAAAGLRGAWSLAWRLHRVSVIVWMLVFALVGVIYGSVAGGVTDMLTSSPGLAKILQQLGGGAALTNAFFAAVVGLVGIIACAYGIAAVLGLRAEEVAGRNEYVLSGPVPRSRLFASHITLALVVPVILLAIVGLVIGVTANAALDDGTDHIGGLLAGALAQVPAVWVTIAIAVLLVGAVPRWSSAGWAGLAGFAVLGQIGQALQFPQWVMDLSPFTHIPRLPGNVEVHAMPLVLLTLTAIALVSAGVVAFRRRDVG